MIVFTSAPLLCSAQEMEDLEASERLQAEQSEPAAVVILDDSLENIKYACPPAV